MKYILTGQDINGKTIHDVFKIKTLKGDSRIFNFKTIVDNIIKCQCEKDLTFSNEWINETEYNNYKFNFNDSIIDLSILETYLTSFTSNIFGKDVDKRSLIKIQIELETEDELNIYLKLFIKETYDTQQPISAILNLKYERVFCALSDLDIRMDNITKLIEVGDYIIYVALIRLSQTWFYVIRKDQLESNIININCYNNLIPYIIGKKGKNINLLKYKLKARQGGEKLKRIEVVPVVE